MQQELAERDPGLIDQAYNQEVGRVFLSARQERHLSIDDVAQVLHIRKTYISAIEDGNFSALPGHVYTLGFMKKYAEFLELDFPELQRRLNLSAEAYSILKVEDLVPPYSSTQNYKRYVWLSVFITVLVTSVYTYAHLSRPVVLEVLPPPLPVEASVQVDSTEKTSLENEPLEEAEPVNVPVKPPVVIICAKQPSWVSLRDASGKSLLSRILKSGERYVVPSLSGLTLDIGNAGGVEILRDDKPMPTLGEAGQVRRGISLDEIYRRSS